MQGPHARPTHWFTVTGLGGFLVLLLLAADCKQGFGDRCEVDSDCADSFPQICKGASTGNGICTPMGGNLGTGGTGTGGLEGGGTGGGAGGAPADAAGDTEPASDAAAEMAAPGDDGGDALATSPDADVDAAGG